MRAARFYNHHDIRVEDIAAPELKPGDGRVLVDIAWCGICGSDLHEYIIGPKMLPVKPHPSSGEVLPLALGHEFCGVVRNPPSESRFRDGEPVMVDPRVLCGSCTRCKDGSGHCCSILGYFGASTNGGYGEQIAISEKSLYPLKNIPLEYAALIEPLAVVQHAIKETGVLDWTGKTVLILGGGPIGFALALVLRAHGMKNIIVSEPTSLRRKQVAEFVTTALNPITDNVVRSCLEATEGRGVDIVFDCAGVQVALEVGMEALRAYGLYINIAVWEKPMSFSCWPLLIKHITLKGVHIFTIEDFLEVIEMMSSGKLPGFEKMVTARISLDDIVEKGFEELINNKDKHIKIMVTPNPKLLGGIRA